MANLFTCKGYYFNLFFSNICVPVWVSKWCPHSSVLVLCSSSENISILAFFAQKVLAPIYSSQAGSLAPDHSTTCPLLSYYNTPLCLWTEPERLGRLQAEKSLKPLVLTPEMMCKLKKKKKKTESNFLLKLKTDKFDLFIGIFCMIVLAP